MVPTPATHRFLTSDEELGAACSAQGWLPLEPDFLAEEKQAHNLLPPWPFMEACAAKALRVVLLAGFASEGDNAPDGMALAGHALRFLRAQQEQQGAAGGKLVPELEAHQFKMPCSWVALYGRNIDYQEAY